MGILSALNTGVAGLAGQGEALSIYSDNIANANTTGFKTSRPEFQDVVAKSLKGTMGGNQIGTGARLAAVSPVFSQGEIVQTESPTDLAIVGDGFFVLKGQDGQSYSRDGKFRFDKDGAYERRWLPRARVHGRRKRQDHDEDAGHERGPHGHRREEILEGGHLREPGPARREE